MIFEESLQAVLIASKVEYSNNKYGLTPALDSVENDGKPLPVPVINETTIGYWSKVESRFKLACERAGVPYTPGCVKPIEENGRIIWVRNEKFQQGNLL